EVLRGIIARGLGLRYSDDKGPSASLAPSAARSTYREYASRAALGRRLAAGPFSSLWPERFSEELLARSETPATLRSMALPREGSTLPARLLARSPAWNAARRPGWHGAGAGLETGVRF